MKLMAQSLVWVPCGRREELGAGSATRSAHPETKTTVKPLAIPSDTLNVGPHAPASQTAHVASVSPFILRATAAVQRFLLSMYSAPVYPSMGFGSLRSAPSSTVAFFALYVTVPGDMYVEEPSTDMRAACMSPPVVDSKTETVCLAALSFSAAAAASNPSGPGLTAAGAGLAAKDMVSHQGRVPCSYRP